jgi:phosphohistidine phosphatase
VTILTVLRHAKSSWDEAELNDIDRPLNARGRKAARQVGRELERRHFRFDAVFASPATRVRETLEELAEGFGESWEIRFDERIYAASAETLFDLVRSIPEDVHAPLLVGHNPGLQELILRLTQDDGADLRRRVGTKFPTAAVAAITLPVPRWDEVTLDSGEIRELILPRELGD